MAEILNKIGGLEVHEVPDGYIVYHATRDTVSYLNATAAVMFEMCNGKLDTEAIVEHMANFYDLGQPAKAELCACFDLLIKEGLVQSSRQ